MAARFELGQDSQVSEISTRVRVNNYTDVHAVAELSDGKLYMTKAYVKASGDVRPPPPRMLRKQKRDSARCDLGNSQNPPTGLKAAPARPRS